MDLASQNQNLFIALGVLSGVGIIVASIRACAWFSKAGRDVVDLAVSTSTSVLSISDSDV